MPQPSDSPRVAIVTGGSRGIGAAISRRLADEGFAVVINYASSADIAEALADTIEQAGGQAIAVAADVASSHDVARLFDAAMEHFGRIDALINNAGVLTTMPLAEVSDELFDRHFEVNTKGTFNTLREAYARLEDGGRIVNISSTALALSLPGYAIYNATKAAVESFTRVYAKELRGRRITVNALAPGPVDTELFRTGKSSEQIEYFANLPPLERLGTPKDIAAAVAFLLRHEAEWINGQVIRANGGIA